MTNNPSVLDLIQEFGSAPRINYFRCMNCHFEWRIDGDLQSALIDSAKMGCPLNCELPTRVALISTEAKAETTIDSACNLYDSGLVRYVKV